MFHLILYFVFLIFKSDVINASETQVIRVSYKRNNEEFTVSKDKPLKIILEDYSSVVLWCRSFYWDDKTIATPFTPTTEFSKTINNFIEIQNVTDDMSTRWKCHILQEYHGPPEEMYNNKRYTVIELFFQIHVKNAKEIMLIANDAVLPTVTTNATADYDAEAHYIYDDGEDIYFKCEIRNHYFEELRLEYYNAQGGLIFKTKLSITKSQQFRSVLKSENNNYYVDCICATFSPNREYRYRVHFNLRQQHLDTNKHALTLYVNGERQLLDKELDPSYDDYRPYKYIEGEPFDVTCKKDRTFKGNIMFYFDENAKADFVSKSEIILPYERIKHNINKSVVCSIINADVKKGFARIDFKSILPESGVRILGLSKKNIMYQYTNDSKWTTAYQFSVNETLNLTCVTKSGITISNHTFEWKFQEETQDSSAEFTSTISTVIMSKLPFVKVLDKRHNQTNIRCTYIRNNKTAEIVLHLKPEITSDIPVDELTAQNDGSLMDLIIMTVVAGIIMIVVAAICSMFWLKRKKHARLIENAYEDMPSQNESPIPAFPAQWENEYSYCPKTDLGVNQEPYSYVISDKFNKRQSNAPSENHYTEIDDYFKPKNDGRNVTCDTAKPVASSSVNKLETDNFNDEKRYENVSNPFEPTYENDLPVNSKRLILSKNDTYSNVPQNGKTVSFQENKPTQAEERMKNDLNPFRNSRKTAGVTPKQNKTNDNKAGNKQGKDINYENVAKDDKKVESSSVYAEPYSDFDEMVTNTLYGKV